MISSMGPTLGIGLWLSVAAAQAPPGPVLAPRAELRLIQTAPDSFPVDPDGRELQWGPALDSRLRLGLDAAWDDGRIALEGDVASGQLLGARWDLPEIDERGRSANRALTAEGFVPRRASVGHRFRWFDAEFGLQTSHWGLGLVANDGSRAPLFGRTDFGDRVLRLRVGTQPVRDVPVYLVLAGDRVVADELARWADGDDAWQGVAALLYRRPSAIEGLPVELGMYTVARTQTTLERDGLRRTDVRVVDATASLPVVLDPLVLALGAEGALITGQTDISRTYAAPDGVAVRSGGLAVRAALRPVMRETWRGELRLALASGDRSADDKRLSDFRFDRDYDVGFVLFDEVAAAYDLAAIRQATDPALAVAPPDGIDNLAAEGAFHQAVALQPALAVAPLPWVEVRVGAVFAWSSGPIAQPYATFRNGGVPTNALGVASEGRYLGTELDLGLATREVAVSGWAVRPSLDVQVGHAVLSRAFGADTGGVSHVLVVGRARY
jgi:hypothetical protein